MAFLARGVSISGRAMEGVEEGNVEIIDFFFIFLVQLGSTLMKRSYYDTESILIIIG